MKKTFLLIFLVAALSLVLFSQATSGKGKMRGIVVDEQTKTPIEGVTIKLYCVKAAGNYKPNLITDSEGKWKALHIRGGLWYIDLEKIGYEPKKISYTVDTTPGRTRDEIETTLKKLEGPALDANAIVEINKAQELFAADKLEEAIKDFDRIKEKYKATEGIVIVNLYIGNAYSKLEKYEEAIKVYMLAIEKYPKHSGLILSIGNCYNNLKQPEKAMEWFTKLPFEEIGNVDTLYNIGVGFYNSYKYDDALKYFARSVEIDNQYAPGYFQLGMTYTALSKTKEAVEAFKKFMELDPDSPDFQTAKALVDAFAQ